jgi:hypothetical protein
MSSFYNAAGCVRLSTENGKLFLIEPLTGHQRNELAAIGKAVGKKQSELIREAVDRLIEQMGRERRELILSKAAGIWKDRTDLPDHRLRGLSQPT